jgi:hypothetical protein
VVGERQIGRDHIGDVEIAHVILAHQRDAVDFAVEFTSSG